MNHDKKILIITPTYNEKDNVREIVTAALDQDSRIDVLVVDDGSPDGTGDIVEEMRKTEPRIHCLHREGKLGLGTAYLAGFKYALERDYDFIFEMDADFSHDPKFIPDFLEKIDQGYDLVVGSRYVHGVTVVNWPIKRLLLSYYANVYARLVTGLPLMDGTGGFKCFRRCVLEAIHLDRVHSNGYSFQIEMSYRAWSRGFRVAEIPIIFVDRNIGISKMSTKIIREAIWMVWWLRMLKIFKKL
ncbi:MAG: dolichyl-phosphate beta-D-mannosyltransferase [Candidatus Cloacimonetes bacterium 4572_55]|nr:MAG: dolichyl-phosphate beta-D-mannosyltransferase [Candidatus Cloacimonetes bacterium 4572_55]